MIILTILLIALVLTAAAIIVPTIFHYKAKWLHYVVCIGLGICLVFGATSIMVATNANETADWLKQESADILLYYNTVNYSDNEYVRYNFYDRVMNYNRVYTAYQDASEQPLTSWLYDTDVLGECGLIDFMLSTGTYG